MIPELETENMTKFETKKLYYNKYLYKVVVQLRTRRLRTLFFSGDHFLNSLSVNLKDVDFRTRNEGDRASVFTNDQSLIEQILFDHESSVLEIWQPDPNKLHILKNANTIIVSNKPSYPVKVTLNDNKISSDLANWIDANPDKACIGRDAYQAVKRGWSSGGLYFYVRDEKILSIVNLLIAGNIRRVDKLVCE